MRRMHRMSKCECRMSNEGDSPLHFSPCPLPTACCPLTHYALRNTQYAPRDAGGRCRYAYPPMLLTGRNLSKSYGPRLLFTGITMGFAEGERVGLIGANGAGKSTLLKIFAGVEQPDEGELV